mgnify:CR=1 FL=1
MVSILRKTLCSFVLLLACAFVTLPSQVAHADFNPGDSGSEIAAIQEKLLLEGYDIGIPDGVYGTTTVEAVKKFQSSVGLAPDGVIGSYTYSKLMGEALPTGRGYGVVSRGGSGIIRNLISTAYGYLGVPYVFGGTSPWGFDCSGFTQYVFRQIGISIPRTADVQYYNYPKVSVSNLQPGDLVFFETYEYGPSHCGIYIGGGQMIQAGSSTGVTVSPVFSGYFGARYIGASRVI